MMFQRFIGAVLWVALSSGMTWAVPPIVGQDSRYKVRKGDTLYKVAKKSNLAVEHIAFANRLSPEAALVPGKMLTIPTRRIIPANHPATGLLVNLPERGVYLFKKDRFLAFYPVAIGEPGFHTPTGIFKIVLMLKDPTWVPPEWSSQAGTVVPAGPQNPLGDRWIGLSAPGIGLHATPDPTSVGANGSHGCLRMYPENARKLFAQVHKGMPVWIVYQPIKIGMDSKTREVAVQIFPDVYHQNSTGHLANKLLKSLGLTSRVSSDKLLKLLANPTGVVTSAAPPPLSKGL